MTETELDHSPRIFQVRQIPVNTLKSDHPIDVAQSAGSVISCRLLGQRHWLPMCVILHIVVVCTHLKVQSQRKHRRRIDTLHKPVNLSSQERHLTLKPISSGQQHIRYNLPASSNLLYSPHSLCRFSPHDASRAQCFRGFHHWKLVGAVHARSPSLELAPECLTYLQVR